MLLQQQERFWPNIDFDHLGYYDHLGYMHLYMLKNVDFYVDFGRYMSKNVDICADICWLSSISVEFARSISVDVCRHMSLYDDVADSGGPHYLPIVPQEL